MKKRTSKSAGIAKCPTGIHGLDEITDGGLPQGRPTLVCGSAGSGKTLLAMEFIVRGACDYDEPGIFIAFEETEDDLAANFASLGFDLPALIREKRIALDYVHVERSEIEETGEYNLEGLFLRLAGAADSVGAKRVAIDSFEALFAGLSNEAIVRAELRRLFAWLKDRGLTAVITAERGHDDSLTRYGIEEYVSDCVILLDHRVINQIATRRLRVVKYRGASHGTNEYPTMIDETGLSVLPISSLSLDYGVSKQRVSSGITALDGMLGGKGYYRNSSVLITGAAGTGKTSFATAFADAACRRDERCLYLAYEESPAEIMRNMSSIGYDLAAWVKEGRLHFHAVRSTIYGLEQHLVAVHKLVEDLRPDCVLMDPVTNLTAVGVKTDVTAMLMRVIDYLKQAGIMALFTSLTDGDSPISTSNIDVSSLMDTWLLLRQDMTGGDYRRSLFILKSRGMPHSSAVREFRLTDNGIELENTE